ncbi:unnamed protein product [Amoebophrya sp. A25]|nr:unnamed protein product [Amoebophrya sp. A25]|eukprot:GSA25T00019901001.1
MPLGGPTSTITAAYLEAQRALYFADFSPGTAVPTSTAASSTRYPGGDEGENRDQVSGQVPWPLPSGASVSDVIAGDRIAADYIIRHPDLDEARRHFLFERLLPTVIRLTAYVMPEGSSFFGRSREEHRREWKTHNFLRDDGDDSTDSGWPIGSGRKDIKKESINKGTSSTNMEDEGVMEEASSTTPAVGASSEELSSTMAACLREAAFNVASIRRSCREMQFRLDAYSGTGQQAPAELLATFEEMNREHDNVLDRSIAGLVQHGVVEGDTGGARSSTDQQPQREAVHVDGQGRVPHVEATSSAAAASISGGEQLRGQEAGAHNQPPETSDLISPSSGNLREAAAAALRGYLLGAGAAGDTDVATPRSRRSNLNEQEDVEMHPAIVEMNSTTSTQQASSVAGHTPEGGQLRTAAEQASFLEGDDEAEGTTLPTFAVPEAGDAERTTDDASSLRTRDEAAPTPSSPQTVVNHVYESPSSMDDYPVPGTDARARSSDIFGPTLFEMLETQGNTAGGAFAPHLPQVVEEEESSGGPSHYSSSSTQTQVREGASGTSARRSSTSVEDHSNSEIEMVKEIANELMDTSERLFREVMEEFVPEILPQDTSTSEDFTSVAAKSLINVANKRGYTALHIAVEAEAVDTVALLLRNGAVANTEVVSSDAPLSFPLSSAIATKNVTLIRLLWLYGCRDIDFSSAAPTQKAQVIDTMTRTLLEIMISHSSTAKETKIET